jgi:hypothetical protein
MQYLNPEEAKGFLAVHIELAAALEINPKYADEEFYAYRITKKGYLHRQPKAHCFNGKWTNYSSCYEKPKEHNWWKKNPELTKFLTSAFARKLPPLGV